MINESVYLVFAFIGGLALGILFFGVLWLTVKKAVTAKIPALWIFGSFFIRTGIILVGFYFISSGNLKRLVVCLVGFMIARFLVIHFTRSVDERQSPLNKEVNHES